MPGREQGRAVPGGRPQPRRGYRITYGITEPVIGPVRRVLRPVRLGSISFDVAFTAVFLAVIILRTVVVPLIPFRGTGFRGGRWRVPALDADESHHLLANVASRRSGSLERWAKGVVPPSNRWLHAMTPGRGAVGVAQEQWAIFIVQQAARTD